MAWDWGRRILEHAEALTVYLTAVIDELVGRGVREVVVSPGSRSTPLALILADRNDVRLYLDIDERSAGFLALGLAKAGRRPVGLLCTSGTAAANYYPAIVEAFFARVPLIVLTADRPHELQDTGAPQTIRQSRMYGRHVKAFSEIEIPEEGGDLLRYTQASVARTVEAAIRRPRGPVHLNFPFREPLVPAKPSGRPASAQFSIHEGISRLSDCELERIAATCRRTRCGIIICGETESNDFYEALVTLSRRLGYPILADPLAQLRRGQAERRTLIDGYDLFLRDPRTARLLRPDLMLRFGAFPVSKALHLWTKVQHVPQLVVDGGFGWIDPEASATEMIYCDERDFCVRLAALVPHEADGAWIRRWRRANDIVAAVVDGVPDEAQFGEAQAFAELMHGIPTDATLFVGNSMPIREVDTFLTIGPGKLRIFANRGASGIDGVVSTAVGVALRRPGTVLVIGDLSFFHDMNGLLAAKLHHAELTIVLINNNGGGIFSFLPQAADPEHFETLFGTPHGLDFSHVARLYGADYRKAEAPGELTTRLRRASKLPGLKIIEVRTKRPADAADRKRLIRSAQTALARWFEGGRQ